MQFIILSISGHHLHAFGNNKPLTFETAELAEHALKYFLDSDYESERSAYEIVIYKQEKIKL